MKLGGPDNKEKHDACIEQLAGVHYGSGQLQKPVGLGKVPQ